jgi:phospholipid/cholesterol/gamma-HCH transport system substrate-binding protein
MTREVRIGIFLATALLIMATFIFIVGDMSTLFHKPGYQLLVSFESAAGLEKTAAVRMSGVKIGYVKDITLVGRKAQVLMSIYPKFKIPKGSRATLASLGLLGEKHLEILASEKEDYCQPGDSIDGLPAVSLDELGTLFLSIGEQVKETGKSLREFAGKESSDHFKSILQNLSSLSADLKDFVGANKDGLSRGIQTSSRSVQNLDQKLKEISQDLEKTLSVIKGIAEENRESIKTDLEKIRDLISKMEDSVTLLNRSLEKVNKGEGTLGKLVNQPDLYNEAERVVADAKGIIRPVSSLKADLGFSSAYYGKSKLLKNSLSVGLWLTPKQYVLGQVVQNPWEDRFVYSAQGGIRLGDFVPRAGILESEFGAGVDYLAFKGSLVVSLDAFDWNRHPRPQFRISSKYFSGKFFYFILGLDDFSLAKKREIFFGLGLGLR